MHSVNHNYISDKPLWRTVTHVLEPVSVPWALNTGTCTSSLWRWAGRPILVCGPSLKAALATANTGKLVRGLGKNMKVNGPGRWKIARKKFLALGPSPGLKRRTFKLWVLNRWDLNFCVRSSPLQGLWQTARSKARLRCAKMRRAWRDVVVRTVALHTHS